MGRGHKKLTKGLSLLLILSMCFSTVSFASEVPAVDASAQETQAVQDTGDQVVPEAPQEILAKYRVRWMADNEEEIAYEDREGIAGQPASVSPEDLLALNEYGYTFRNDDERNVQTGTVAEDGSLELKLYFDAPVSEEVIPDPAQNAGEDSVPEETEGDVVNDESGDDADGVAAADGVAVDDAGDGNADQGTVLDEKIPETPPEAENTEENTGDAESAENDEVVYKVEWRNPFGMLIQEETRSAMAGTEVSVTEEDKNFDSTFRYFFNEEAELNVLSGVASGDLVLVMYFDDAQSVAPMAVGDNNFYFQIDMRPYGGQLYTRVRYDMYPSAEFRPIWDKFDWASVDKLWDYQFAYYWSDWGDSPAGATTPGYGTFYSRNKTAQYGCEWYFGYPKLDGISERTIHWMPAFVEGSVKPKSGFRVDVNITGDYEETIRGNNVVMTPGENKTFIVGEHLPVSFVNKMSDRKYSYTFAGYELVNGNGLLENEQNESLCTIIPTDMCVVLAKYEVRETDMIKVDVNITGEMQRIFNGSWAYVSDLSDYHLKNQFHNDVSSVLDNPLYDFVFKGYEIVSGKNVVISDVNDENALFENCTGYVNINAIYEAVSKSKIRVDVKIQNVDSTTGDIIDETIVEGDYVPYSSNDIFEFVPFDYLSSSAYKEIFGRRSLTLDGSNVNYIFLGYELVEGSGEFIGDVTDQNCKYRALPGNTSIIKMTVKCNSIKLVGGYQDFSYNNTHVFRTDTIRISGDVPFDVSRNYQDIYMRHSSTSLSFGTVHDWNGTSSFYNENHVKKYIVDRLQSAYGLNVDDDYIFTEVDHYSKIVPNVYISFGSSVSSNQLNDKNLVSCEFVHEYEVIKKSSFQLNTRIYGATEALISGVKCIHSSLGLPEYNLKDYVDETCLRGYDADYEYNFKGYVVKSGSGDIENPLDIDSAYTASKENTVIEALYEAVESDNYANVSVKIHTSGIVNQDVDLDTKLVRIDSVIDLNDYLVNIDTSILPNFDLTQYSAPSYSIKEGDGALNGSVYSGMSGGSESILYINYEVTERDWDPSVMYLIFEDGNGNKIFDALPTKDGNVTVPIGYYMDGHKKKFSHKAWKDKITGEDICLPSISSAKNVTITKTTTVVPRLEYYMDNLRIASNVKVVYEDGRSEVVPDLQNELILEHNANSGTRNVKLKQLLLNDKLTNDYYRYDFSRWQLGDSFVADSNNTIALNDEENQESASLDWVVKSYSTTGKDSSYANLTQEYRVVCVANDFKVNTVITGANDLILEGKSERAMLSDVISLQPYVNQDAFSDDRFIYTFKGYEIVSGSGQLTSSKSENSSLRVGSHDDGMCEVNAVYEAVEKPTLTYDTKGGSSVDPTYPEDGRFMVTRRVPTKEDYVFKGWSISEAATDVDYIGGDMLSGSKDRTLYAVWVEDDGSGNTPGGGDQPSVPTAKTYTLSYVTNTDAAIADQKSNTGSFTVTRRTPEKDGFTFAGWSLDETADKASEVDYFAGDVFPAQKDVTLYAVFVPKEEAAKYTITYDSKGGTEVAPTKAENGVLMVTRRTPEKKGYVFAGWSLDSGAKDIDYIAGDKLGAVSDVKLYAVYVKTPEEKTYVLSYDTLGGTEVADTEAIEGKFMVTRRTPLRDGKVFLGWSLYPDDTDIDFIAGDYVLADRNRTLYAVYADAADAPEVQTYTITYDTRGGSSVAETKSYNGIFTVTRRQPDLADKVFVGWTLDPDSENPLDVDYVGGDTFPAENNVTLYALYRDADIVVNTNGGSDVETNVTVVENKYIITITIPQKPGYEFPGWDTDGDGVPDVDPDQPIETENPDVPIDAVWQLKVTPAQYVTTGDSVWLSDMVWDNQTAEADANVVRGIDDALIDDEGRAMVQIPVTTPMRTGYVFLGWDLNQPMLALGDNEFYQAGDKVYMDEIDSLYEMGLRFTAQWEPDGTGPVDPGEPDHPSEEITVTWKDGYTETPIETETVDRNITDEELRKLYPNEPGREGFVFERWDVVRADDGNITITAVWRPGGNPDMPEDKVTATWMDGYTDTEIKSETVDRDITDADLQGLYPEDPARDGFAFDGWDVTRGDDGSIVITALWKPADDSGDKDDPKDPVDPDDSKEPGDGDDVDKDDDGKPDGADPSNPGGNPGNGSGSGPAGPGMIFPNGNPGNMFQNNGTVNNYFNKSKSFNNSGMILTGGSKFVNKTGGSGGIQPVKTGDTQDAAPYGVLFLGSLVALVAMLEKKKRETEA